MKITINAGHMPGKDPGAIGPRGIQEAGVTREVALLVVEMLRKKHEVQFVQSDSLQGICDVSNAFKSDIFVSIHCNGFDLPTAHGVETLSSGSGASAYLSRCIQDSLVKASNLTDRGVKECPGLYVLKNTTAPACMVEMAFITNPNEENLLISVSGQRMFAKAIVDGIENWANSQQKE